MSKTADAPYASGNRGLWRKAKCLNRQEFVVVGWTDPEGSRPHLGALLLGYYTDDGKLTYAGRVGTGMSEKVLKDLRRRLEPLKRAKSPLNAPPRAQRGLARRSCCRTCIGSTRSSSSRPPFSPGPPTISCGRRSMSGCARTNRPSRCVASRKGNGSASKHERSSEGTRKRTSQVPHASGRRHETSALHRLTRAPS